MLDPEGKTIARALAQLGHEGVDRVHAGRLVTLELEAPDPETARERTAEMCEELIANPVIEDYRIDVRESPAAGSASAAS